MGDIEPGMLVVRRAAPSDHTALTETDPIAAAGDRARRAGIRRWCEQGLALLAEDARAGPWAAACWSTPSSSRASSPC